MKNNLTDLYHLYKVCVVRITVETKHGDLATGAGFHIGDGYIVTARHVIEDAKIIEIVGHSDADHHESIAVRRVLTLNKSKADVAVLETDFALSHFMTNGTIMAGDEERPKTDHIQVGGHLSDWLNDGFTLSKVLLMGFPPVPFTTDAVLVATEAEVNAVVDTRLVEHPCFIVSAIPRGGFSGGPAISEYGEPGLLLGVVTDSLFEGEHSELGFATVLTIEPIIDILVENGIYPAGCNKAFLQQLSILPPDDPE